MSYTVHADIDQVNFGNQISISKPDPRTAGDAAASHRNRCLWSGVALAAIFGGLTYYGLKGLKTPEGTASTLATVIALGPLLCCSGCGGGCAQVALNLERTAAQEEAQAWDAADSLIANASFGSTWNTEIEATRRAALNKLPGETPLPDRAEQILKDVTQMAAHLDKWSIAVNRRTVGDQKARAQEILQRMACHAKRGLKLTLDLAPAASVDMALDSGRDIWAIPAMIMYSQQKARFLALENALRTGIMPAILPPDHLLAGLTTLFVQDIDNPVELRYPLDQ